LHAFTFTPKLTFYLLSIVPCLWSLSPHRPVFWWRALTACIMTPGRKLFTFFCPSVSSRRLPVPAQQQFQPCSRVNSRSINVLQTHMHDACFPMRDSRQLDQGTFNLSECLGGNSCTYSIVQVPSRTSQLHQTNKPRGLQK
jgi:hypothetical protein